MIIYATYLYHAFLRICRLSKPRTPFSNQLSTQSKPDNCDNYAEASTLTVITEPRIVIKEWWRFINLTKLITTNLNPNAFSQMSSWNSLSFVIIAFRGNWKINSLLIFSETLKIQPLNLCLNAQLNLFKSAYVIWFWGKQCNQPSTRHAVTGNRN